ncbi:MAG TPA: diguanylate cyclase, partial [Baekduia sp.]|nr:diguanylate cyclase [Baekduia sp.]
MALTMFFVGSVVCGLGAELKPDLTAVARAVQLGAGGGLGLCGLVLWGLPARRWLLEAGALLSVVLLGLMMASSNAVGATPFFFLWPLVFLAYFATRRLVIAGMAVMTVTAGVASVVNPSMTDRLDTFVGTVLSVGLMAGLVTLMTRREQGLRQALAAAAGTDALTGLLNRRGFAPELERLMSWAAAEGGRFAVVMVDLDHFKRFNDLHGHLVGDEALRRLAAALTAAAGAAD